MAVKRPAASIPGAPPPTRGRARVGGGRDGGNVPLVQALVAAWAIPELRRRLQFIFLMFAVYTLGLHIPIPGINHAQLDAQFSKHGGGGILNLIDVFSGGALKQFTVFAMGIVPYINASIIMQLLTFAVPSWQEMAKEGEAGRKRIAQYTRYMTVVLGIVQAAGVTTWLHRGGVITGSSFQLVGTMVSIMVTLMAGTAFLMWISELITERGIGNGVSLIIFCGIMVRLPHQIAGENGLLDQVKAGTVQPWQLALLVISFVASVVGVIYVTLGERKVPIQHVRRIQGNKMSQGGTSYLPFRVASAGVIPIIFALSIQMLPATILTFIPAGGRLHDNLEALSRFLNPGQDPFSVSGLAKGLIYAGIIVFFTYFYTAVTMNVEDMADQLKKYGSYIPGIRPGKPTVEYLDRVMTRITLAGALFLAVIALLQYWIPALTNTAGGGANGLSFIGGTSLLIVVSVALDTMRAIEAQLLMRNYEGFIR